MKGVLVATVGCVLAAGVAWAEPVEVNLEDYAFDFPQYGYEIAIKGTTRNIHDNLTADDYITIEADGYKIKTLIDRMSRKDRRGFIAFFNTHCITGFEEGCIIAAAGDVELNEDMRMIFRPHRAELSKDGQTWATGAGQ